MDIGIEESSELEVYGIAIDDWRMRVVGYAANSRVLTDGSRVAPAAKYRIHHIPWARTNTTRDPCGCVGWVRTSAWRRHDVVQTSNFLTGKCAGLVAEYSGWLCSKLDVSNQPRRCELAPVPANGHCEAHVSDTSIEDRILQSNPFLSHPAQSRCRTSPVCIEEKAESSDW